MRTAAISFSDVWKSYPRWTPGSRTLRGVVTRRMPTLARLADQRWALKGVSFDVPRGQSVGLVGHNGAGKSTLLRLASGVGRPTRGSIRIAARTASVLSLGDSFDFALTGRENALTAAMVAGVPEPTARRLVPAALQFAELEDFADAPVRTYSEGMKLRLAFGVVAQLRPEVLLLDEVISVGDLRFQVKCLQRIEELKESGTTVLLASHGLDEITAQCERAIWLHSGAVRAAGAAEDVVATYREAMISATIERTPAGGSHSAPHLELRRNRMGSQEITVEDVRLTAADGEPTTIVRSGGSMTVSFVLRRHGPTAPDPIVVVAVRRTTDGIVCLDSNTLVDGVRLGSLDHAACVAMSYERLDLLPGHYAVEVGIFEHGWEYAYDVHLQAYPFRVVGQDEAQGVFRAPHRWEVTA